VSTRIAGRLASKSVYGQIMTFNIQAIVQNKDAKRRELSAMPIAEKLRMMDELRERTLAIQGASVSSQQMPAASFVEVQGNK
jgi:hypothetical protein